MKRVFINLIAAVAFCFILFIPFSVSLHKDHNDPDFNSTFESENAFTDSDFEDNEKNYAGSVPIEESEITEQSNTEENEPLFNKRIIGVGDSLMRGDKLLASQTWLGLIESEYGAVTFNYGKNGNPLANVSSSSVTGMVGRIDGIYEEVPQADYFVLIGGANDKRLNVPIGEDDSTDIETFCGAINSIIDKVREYWPEAHIIFMTNYDRYKDNNSLGFGDIDYVEAMKRVCEKKKVFCYDNFHDSGVDFQDPDFISWADEGIYLGGSSNFHFSPEGYRWLLPKYKLLLEEN
ncbi:MAG: SGNH/GDSL hydrolase family protein [Lachnospiraceae bacterium]|nr:SGNH/GDSL hydrolase family protein [Lachnospiraceae bacterium]